VPTVAAASATATGTAMAAAQNNRDLPDPIMVPNFDPK
jgi:hypothetical protein